jgi:hypothetical protein
MRVICWEIFELYSIILAFAPEHFTSFTFSAVSLSDIIWRLKVEVINILNKTFLFNRPHFQITILNYGAHNLSQLVHGLLLRINDAPRRRDNSMDRKEGGVGIIIYIYICICRVLYIHLLLNVCTPFIIRDGDSQTLWWSGGTVALLADN